MKMYVQWYAETVFVCCSKNLLAIETRKFSNSENAFRLNYCTCTTTALKLTGDDYLPDVVISIYFDVIKFYTNAS